MSEIDIMLHVLRKLMKVQKILKSTYEEVQKMDKSNWILEVLKELIEKIKESYSIVEENFDAELDYYCDEEEEWLE